MFEKFARDARRTVIVAQEEALMLRSAQLDPRHFLLAILLAGEPPVRQALEAAGFTAEQVREDIRSGGGRPEDSAGPGRPGAVLDAEDVQALRSIGIDLDAVRESIEAQFGPDALSDEPLSDETPSDRAVPDPAEGRRRGPAGTEGECGHGRGDARGRRGRGRRGGRFGRVRLDSDAKKTLHAGLAHAARAHAGEITSAHILLGVLSGASGPTKRLVESRTSPEDLAARVRDVMDSAA
ncbi:Clp protease N-terminal domain-containing protein [Tomitella cavernea]|uniref:Clp protease N-terminal domain-containing protein n=1 Tax=Tomitella cavernea TaxID=1387982 RepID=A0ABP9C8E5_9ACTN|nr:Clp protease N-terminal domain-containing protein [Tomitella cavernea]